MQRTFLALFLFLLKVETYHWRNFPQYFTLSKQGSCLKQSCFNCKENIRKMNEKIIYEQMKDNCTIMLTFFKSKKEEVVKLGEPIVQKPCMVSK